MQNLAVVLRKSVRRLFRFLRNAKPPQGAFEFDDRVAEGAERGFHVTEEFVDALGVLASGHSGIAAGDAFDEVHERFLYLAGIVDRRRAFRAGEVGTSGDKP